MLASRRIAWAVGGALLLLTAALIGRLTLQVAQMHTGAELLLLQWQQASLGWCSSSPAFLERSADDQARFWLTQSERITRAEPTDAELAMGAALVLQLAWTKLERERQLAAARGPRGEMSQRCVQACLEHAEQATRRQPENPHWWRIRAQLLFSNLAFPHEVPPRRDDWEMVLEQCRAHDPENALYDYLAALQCWALSSHRNPFLNWLIIDDAELFERGIAYYEQAQRQPHLTVGEKHLTVTDRFMRSSGLTRLEQMRYVDYPYSATPCDLLLLTLNRYQQFRANGELHQDDAGEAFRLLGQNLRCLEQFVEGSRCQRMSINASALRFGTLQQMTQIVAAKPTLFPDDELSRLERLTYQAQQSDRLFRAVRHDSEGEVNHSSHAVPVAVFTHSAPQAILGLLVICMVGAFLARGLAAHRPWPLSAPMHAGLWIASFGGSYLLFGYAPARLDARSQSWLISFVLIGLTGVLVCRALEKAVRSGGLRFQLKTIFLIVLLVGGVLAGGRALGVRPEQFTEFPFLLWVPGDRTYELGHFQQIVTVALDLHGWKSFAEWAGYGSVLLAVVLWAGLALVSSIFAVLREPVFWARRYWAGLLDSLAKSAGSGAVALLLLYLMLLPAALQLVEREYRQHKSFLQDRAGHWVRFEHQLKVARAASSVEGTLRQVAETRGGCSP